MSSRGVNRLKSSVTRQNRRCINCSFLISKTLPIHSLEQASTLIIKLLQSWITPTQLSSECVLCTECLTLLQDRADTFSEGCLSLPAFGHRSICFPCGSSILRAKRTYPVRQDRPERNILVRHVPLHLITRLERVCAACWRSATRKVQQCDQHDSNLPGDHSHHRNYSEKEDVEEIAENPVVAESCADAGDADPLEEPRVFAESCADAGDSSPVEELRVDNTDVFDDNDDDDDSDTLVESNICRVCLALDVKMYDLKDIELREMFQNITGIIVTENNHSILERLCWECAGRLKAAAAFRNKALLSDALLQGLANTGEEIRKNDITSIKENKNYLKSARTLSIVEVFHTVEIDPENESLPFISENSDTEIVQNTRKDSIDLQESVIEENNDEMDVVDEMIETPIKTEIEYDNICPNTGEENINIVSETDPLFSDNIPLTGDTTNPAYSSPSCSHIEPKYPILACLRKTPSGCEFNKIKKSIITNRDSISKKVFKKPKDENTLKGVAKLKNINVKVAGISKKTSNQKLLKKTQVKANTLTEEECLSLEDLEF